MNKLLIIGAGGHGRVVASVAKLLGKYEYMAFVDDAETRQFDGFQVIGKLKDIDSLLKEYEVIVAIGNNQTRCDIMNSLSTRGARFATLIHPSAILADDVTIGAGSVVMANAVINCGSHIGDGVIINTAATIGHDDEILDFVHISPGAHLAGTVRVGEATWICIGALVSNNVSICGDCVIGAGAVVVRDIVKSGTYIGQSRVMCSTDKRGQNAHPGES